MGLPCGGWWCCSGLFLFGVCPVPEDIRHGLPQFDCGTVPRHRTELGDWFAPFQHDGNDCHLCGFPPSSPCGCLGGRYCALHVSSSAADFELVAADLTQDAGEARHGFTVLSSVLLVCGCAHHATLIRRDVWIIQHRGKLFFPVVWESFRSVRVRVRSFAG